MSDSTLDSPLARQPRLGNAALWTIQGSLAVVFLFAGGMKLAIPAGALARACPLPVPFMRFIAVAELTGALGLVLPGVFQIHRELTPLAAAGLAIIMIGATVVTIATVGGATALVPVVVGALAAVVALGRTIRPR